MEKVARLRLLLVEEGPLGDWLWRNLRPHAEEMVVCNPRRNHSIARVKRIVRPCGAYCPFNALHITLWATYEGLESVEQQAELRLIAKTSLRGRGKGTASISGRRSTLFA